MTTSHATYLGTAFLQLSFAVKLRHYIDEHPIDKGQFDISLTVEDADDRICLPHNEFKSQEDLLLAADNNISICFGVAAISLWLAIEEKGEGEVDALAVTAAAAADSGPPLVNRAALLELKLTL